MTEFDPARRELCPDDTCVGVIGADGHCRECGIIGAWARTHSRNQGLVAAGGEGLANKPFDDLLADDRELCPDGACIGLIGPDGRCKQCGRSAAGPPALAAPGAPPKDDPHDVPDTSPDDFDRRVLCPDGACIGLVGPDGRCRECGRTAA
jgi:hypothetical protein